MSYVELDHSVLSAATRPTMNPKSCVSWRKEPTHLANSASFCICNYVLLLSHRSLYVLTRQELPTMLQTIKDDKFRLANISRFSDRRWCRTTSFHFPTLPWQHCISAVHTRCNARPCTEKCIRRPSFFLAIIWHEPARANRSLALHSGIQSASATFS